MINPKSKHMNEGVTRGEALSVMDILLGGGLPNLEQVAETAQVEVLRLSEIAGAPVVFTLRRLSFEETVTARGGDPADAELRILTCGLIDPDLNAPALLAQFDVTAAIGPRDIGWDVLTADQRRKISATSTHTLLKRMLTPGEIADLSRVVERLSGYRKITVAEVKNG